MNPTPSTLKLEPYTLPHALNPHNLYIYYYCCYYYYYYYYCYYYCHYYCHYYCSTTLQRIGRWGRRTRSIRANLNPAPRPEP